MICSSVSCVNSNDFILSHSFSSSLILSFCVSVTSLQETTLTVTEKAVKEVMRLDDEVFSRFYRHVTDIPRGMPRVPIDDDFDAIFGKHTPK